MRSSISFFVGFPEVFHRHLAGGLGGHAGVDEADVGVADERDVALEVAIEERGPRVELAADFLFVVAERVGVVVARDHRQPLARAGGELLLGAVQEDLAEGRVALSRRDAGLSAPCVIRREYLLNASTFATGMGLEVARRPDLVELVVVAGHDVLRLRLCEDGLADTRRVLDRGSPPDAGVRLLVRSLDLGDQVDAEADHAQRARVGRRWPCSPRSPQRRRAPRSRGRRALRARRHGPVAGADPSGCRSWLFGLLPKVVEPEFPAIRAHQRATRRTERRYVYHARGKTRLIRDQDAFIETSAPGRVNTRLTALSQPSPQYVRRFVERGSWRDPSPRLATSILRRRSGRGG